MTVEGLQGWPLACVFNVIDWWMLGEALCAHFSRPERASAFIQSCPQDPPLHSVPPGSFWTRDRQKAPGDQLSPDVKWAPHGRAWWLGEVCAGGEPYHKVQRGAGDERAEKISLE